MQFPKTAHTPSYRHERVTNPFSNTVARGGAISMFRPYCLWLGFRLELYPSQALSAFVGTQFELTLSCAAAMQNEKGQNVDLYVPRKW